MKRLAYAPIAALLLSLSYVSLSADPPDRPAGVAAENWVAVSDRLGIVLVEPTGLSGLGDRLEMVLVDPGGRTSRLPRDPGPIVQLAPSQALLLKPPVGGYFMVKGANGWTRLVVFEPVKGPGDAG